MKYVYDKYYQRYYEYKSPNMNKGTIRVRMLDMTEFIERAATCDMVFFNDKDEMVRFAETRIAEHSKIAKHYK